MRFGAVAMVGLMVAAGVAQAQQAKADPKVPTEQQKTVVLLQGMVTALNGSECPGALRARQQATGGAAIWTTALEDPYVSTARPRGLGIHVDFQTTKTVKALELRLSYLPLGLHRMEVTPAFTNTMATQPQERTKTFNLDREAATRIDANLLVGPAATITRVHLVSATFADGTVWHAPSDDACSVVPDRFMEVAAR